MKAVLKNILLQLTPGSLREAIIHQYKSKNGIANGHYQYSFAQQTEDLHIQRYFGTLGHGFYVDIGAYHPFQYSNSQLEDPYLTGSQILSGRA